MMSWQGHGRSPLRAGGVQAGDDDRPAECAGGASGGMGFRGGELVGHAATRAVNSPGLLFFAGGGDWRGPVLYHL